MGSVKPFTLTSSYSIHHASRYARLPVRKKNIGGTYGARQPPPPPRPAPPPGAIHVVGQVADIPKIPRLQIVATGDAAVCLAAGRAIRLLQRKYIYFFKINKKPTTGQFSQDHGCSRPGRPRKRSVVYLPDYGMYLN